MKYKFLYRLLASFKFRIYDAKINSSEDVGLSFYNELYEYVYEFKLAYPNADTTCLELIFDKFILNSFNVLTCELDASFKIIKSILSSSSIEDFKVYYFFQLFIDKCITGLIEPTYYGKRSLTENKTHFILLQSVSVLFIILSGGILYKKLKINNSYLILGPELDKIFDQGYNSPLLNANGLNDAIFNTSNMGDFLSKLLKKASSPVLSTVLLEYYSSIVTLFIISNLNNSCEFASNLSLDDFKIPVSRLLYYLKDEHSLTETLELYKCNSEITEIFYSRKVLVPKGGLVIKSKDNSFDSLVLELTDDVYGHLITALSKNLNFNNTICHSFYLSHNLSTCRRPPSGIEYVFNLLGITEKLPKDGFLSIPTLFILDNSYGELNMMLTTVDDVGEYDVLEPTYWKYSGLNNSHTKTQLSKPSSYFIKEKKTIDPFKRRLPNGYRRSNEANELARKLCVKLEDDETIVSGFERLQNSKHFNK